MTSTRNAQERGPGEVLEAGESSRKFSKARKVLEVMESSGDHEKF